jgi:hypothetical protein
MAFLKMILVGLVFWLSTGFGFAVVFGVWSLVKTGNVVEGGFILPGGALGGCIMGFIMGLAISGISSLVFAGMCWLRPWAYLRLSAVAPIWGILLAGMTLLVLLWLDPPGGQPVARASAWLLWAFAVLPLARWWIPWLWKRE